MVNFIKFDLTFPSPLSLSSLRVTFQNEVTDNNNNNYHKLISDFYKASGHVVYMNYNILLHFPWKDNKNLPSWLRRHLECLMKVTFDNCVSESPCRRLERNEMLQEFDRAESEKKLGKSYLPLTAKQYLVSLLELSQLVSTHLFSLSIQSKK